MTDQAVRSELRRYTARNSGTSSQNPMHQDRVAKENGFSGALVPGIATYGVALDAVLEAHGPTVLQDRVVDVSFTAPVYENELVSVQTTPADDGDLHLTATAGDERPRMRARFRRGDVDLDRSMFSSTTNPPEPVTMSEATLLDLPWLRTVETTPTPTEIGDYLRGIGVPAERTTPDGTVHPAYLCKLFIEVLNATYVRRQPQIHVGSVVEHLAPVPIGERLTLRGRLRHLFGRKGHRFSVTTYHAYDSGDRLLMLEQHTSIYQLRSRGDERNAE